MCYLLFTSMQVPTHELDNESVLQFLSHGAPLKVNLDGYRKAEAWLPKPGLKPRRTILDTRKGFFVEGATFKCIVSLEFVSAQ